MADGPAAPRNGKGWLLAAATTLAAAAMASWTFYLQVVGDDYFHILTGRQVLAHGFPATDFISWTSEFLRPSLVAHEWLYQVTVALLYGRGGFRLTQALIAALCLVAAALMARLFLRRTGNAKAAAALVLLAGTLLSLDVMTSLQPRPQTGSVVILLALMLLLERGGPARWLSLPLLALGVNWHGGFWPVYALVVAYYAVRDRDPLLPLVLGGLLLNPYGFRMLSTAATFGGNTASFAVVAPEWARTTLWPDNARGLASLAAYAAVLLGLFLGRPRGADLALVLGFLVLGLAGRRFVILLPLVALPVLAAYWRPAADRLLDRLPGAGRRAVATAAFLVLPAVLLAGIAAGNLLSPAARQPRQDLPDRTVWYRTAGLNSCLDYVRSTGETRVLNTQIDLGGYMAFAGVRPFVDNRADVYLPRQADGRDIWDEVAGTWTAPESVTGLIRKYRIALILVPDSGSVARVLKESPDAYPLRYSAGGWAVYGVAGDG